MSLLFSAVAKVKLFWFEIDAWDILGFVAQLLFFSRFLFQWLASERRGHSYVPVYFWWISLGGAVLLLVYLVGLERPPVPLIAGQICGFSVYARNLVLIRRKRRLEKAGAVEAGDALYIHSNENPPGTPSGDAAQHG